MTPTSWSTSKRFADSGGWGWGAFAYDAGSDSRRRRRAVGRGASGTSSSVARRVEELLALGQGGYHRPPLAGLPAVPCLPVRGGRVQIQGMRYALAATFCLSALGSGLATGAAQAAPLKVACLGTSAMAGYGSSAGHHIADYMAMD